MNIYLYRNGSHKVETDVDTKELRELLKDQTNFIWVDLEKPTEREEDEILAGVFDFHPLTIEDCRTNHAAPKIEEYSGYLYFEMHGVRADATSADFQTKELDAYLGENFVVTYHHDEFISINNVKRQIQASAVSCSRGSSYLLHQILDQIVDNYAPLIEDFERSITSLEDRIFDMKRPNNNILVEIAMLRRSIVKLRRVSQRQLDILYRMSQGEFPHIDKQMLPFYRDIYDHLLRISDLSESYREMVGNLMDTYLGVQANRANDVMKVLTMFSAVVLPLTLIAGIYGMNFTNMPEIETDYGYFVVLGVMVIVAVIMLIYFRQKGWLGGNNDD